MHKGSERHEGESMMTEFSFAHISFLSLAINVPMLFVIF